MSLFQKSKAKTSSRHQIKIKEVKDNVLILPNNQYRSVIETSSVNFELKSDGEQDALIDNFQNFINSLPNQIQILIRVRELDIDRYIEQMLKDKDKEKNKVYKAQIENYCGFIKKLVSGNKILSRKFYIVVPFKNKENIKDFDLIKEQLLSNQDLIIKGLNKLGMKAKTLDSLELLDLFYSFYNPSQIKTQELKRQTIQAIFNQPYA